MQCFGNNLYIKNNSKQMLFTRNSSQSSASFRKPKIIKELAIFQFLGEDCTPK